MSIILAIIAFVWIYSLSKRIDALERGQGRVTSEAKASPLMVTEAEVAAAQKIVQPQVPAPHVDVVITPPEPDIFTRFFAWLRIDFMVKLGAFLLLCALGWFVSYAFMNNLIGEAGRIALGLITGTAFLILGYWRIRTEIHQGGIFTVLGSTTILLTVYAARTLYDFFTPLTALGLMFLSVAFVALVAVRWNSERLALASLLLASIAPLFTDSPYPDVVERFTYLLVIVFGTLWVVYLRGWSTLTLGALVSVFLHGFPYLSGIGTGDRDIVLLFTFVFTAIFFVANILGLIANENEKNRIPHLLIAGGTGLYLIIWILEVAPVEWQSLLFATWMLVFSVGSFIVYRTVEKPEAFYLYGVTSIALLGAATASELSGSALTIAYTLEVGTLVFLAGQVLRKAEVASALGVLFVVPVILSFDNLTTNAWASGVFHPSFFVLVVLMITLGISAVVINESEKREGSMQNHIDTLLFSVTGLYAIALVWLVLHAGSALTYDTATLFALLIYTVVGIVCFTKGTVTEQKPLRYAGSALIALAVGRLLLVEVWNMALTGRIITFGLIGLLLISTAFLKRKKDVTINQ